MDVGSIVPVAVVVLCGVALVGVGAGLTEIGPWYRALRKPSWQPPDYLFGPVWTVIFVLMGISALLAWTAAESTGARPAIVAAFGINALLNAAWSGIFFKLRRPDWALVELGFLWASILWIVAAVKPVSELAAWMILPYLAWVTFAGVLNFTIVRLNRPWPALRES